MVGLNRVLHYCHDTYGLGHISRAVAIAQHVAAERPGATQLIVTGSPVAHRISFPPNTDYLKLPSVMKTGAGRYTARSLAVPVDTVRDMRAAMLVDAARIFKPDVVLVDHAPAGMLADAVPALRVIRRELPETVVMLGLRDVVDSPEATAAEWDNVGAYGLFEDAYDRLLVYGQREILDIAQAYRLSNTVAEKLHYVGYLRRSSVPPADPVVKYWLDTAHAARRQVVLATAGGGQDGAAVLGRLIADVVERYPAGDAPFRLLVVTGPFMPEEDRLRLRALANDNSAIRLTGFVEGLSGTIAAADVVVSMMGYNTTTEILSAGTPAVVVPRVTPRQEQLIRARALARRNLVRLVHPTDLVPGRLIAEVEETLRRPHRPHRPVCLDGLPNSLAAIEAALAERRGERGSADDLRRGQEARRANR